MPNQEQGTPAYTWNKYLTQLHKKTGQKGQDEYKYFWFNLHFYKGVLWLPPMTLLCV